MDEERDDRGYRVTDRRRFTESGEPRAADPPPAGGSAAEPPAAGEPAITFASFILGLSTQALMALGEIENPMTRQREKDLGAARQLIDVLAILQDKTRNNLSPDESELMESMLYDLRLRYVDIARSGTTTAKEDE